MTSASKDDEALRALPRRRLQGNDTTTSAAAVPQNPSLAYLLQQGHQLQARERRVSAMAALSRSTRLGALLDLQQDVMAQQDALLAEPPVSPPSRPRSYSPSSTRRTHRLIAHSLRAARRVLESTWEPDDERAATTATTTTTRTTDTAASEAGDSSSSATNNGERPTN